MPAGRRVVPELPGPSDTLCLGWSSACCQCPPSACCLGSHGFAVVHMAQYRCLYTSSLPVSHGELCKKSNLAQCGGLKHDVGQHPSLMSPSPRPNVPSFIQDTSPLPADVHQLNTPPLCQQVSKYLYPSSQRKFTVYLKIFPEKKIAGTDTGTGKGIIIQVVPQDVP